MPTCICMNSIFVTNMEYDAYRREASTVVLLIGKGDATCHERERTTDLDPTLFYVNI